MSDSEDDLLSNPFHYQNDITVISAKGPNINTGNMSFRNNFSSTLQFPRTFEPRYAESCYNLQTKYSRRDPSPMSVASACDARSRKLNYNNSQYRGMSSQRSVYNDRSGSPMSVRTTDSTASVRASDIAMALKHVKCNKYEMRIIKKAFYDLVKKKSRKKIEKRRNLLKSKRRRSGNDLGEQASDSSLSSDDGRSVRTGFEDMSSCRSTKTDLVAEIRKNIIEGNIYKDCSENFRQLSFRKMVNGPTDLNNTQASTSLVRNPSHSFHTPRLKSTTLSLPTFQTQKERFQNGFVLPSQRFNKSVVPDSIPEIPCTQNSSSMKNPIHNFHTPRLKSTSSTHSLPSFQTQKERFKNGLLLPSQRFNKSAVPHSIPEIPHKQNDDTDSDYDLFSTNKSELLNNDSRKRNIMEEDVALPNNKRPKVLSPCKNSIEAKKSTKESNNKETENTNDFEFAKPIMPVRKFKEKLISKSGPPPPEIVIEPPKNQPANKNRISKEIIDLENMNSPDVTNINETSDVSMRPSFIKRKLFTQKMDVIENKNQSSDNINSPQNSIYGAIQKEKHKARKLVANQSCLSRDIGDDNNLLDLIHKIVPANNMNVTTQSNVNKTNVNHNRSINSDKFDVTSIITAKNDDDDVSDTFTDEEMLNGDNNTINNFPNEKSKQNSIKNSKIKEKTKAVESKTKRIEAIEKTKAVESKTKQIEAIEKSKVNELDKVKKTPVKEKVKEPSMHFKEKNCNVSLEKISIANLQKTLGKKDVNKPKSWSTFWDIDSESDIESLMPKHNQSKDSNNESENLPIKNTTVTKGIGATFKNPSVLNSTTMSAFDTTQRLNITGFKIRSHRTPKLKKCCEEVKGNTITSYFETSIRNNRDTSIVIDHEKSEKNMVQNSNKSNIVKTQNNTKNREQNNTKTIEQKVTTTIEQKSTKTTEQKTSKKVKKTPTKEKPSKKNNVIDPNTHSTEKIQKKNEPKKKTTPKKRGQPPKTETQNTKSLEKNKPKTPTRFKENTKDKGTNNSEGKPKNGEIRPLKNNIKENQEPKKTQNNMKSKKQDNNSKNNNKNTQKIVLDSSITNSSLENNNSKIYRAIRSCRISKNSTMNSSKDSFNFTMTLRSRNVDLSMNKSGMKLNLPVKESRSRRIR